MPDLFQTTLQEAAYEGVVFPVTDAPTDGGHDSVEHVAYRRPGADIEPTGLKAYRGTLTVPLINGLTKYGDLFPGTYFDLISKFESTPIGRLSHPTKGTFTALIQSWPERLTSQNRSGVILEVHWIEHNASTSSLLAPDQHSPRDTPTAAQTQSEQCDSAMAAVSPTVPFLPVEDVFSAQLAFLEAKTRSYGEISSSVAILLSAVNANLSLPGFAMPSAHDAVVALEQLRAVTYQLQDRYLSTQGRPRLYTVPTTMPLFQIASEVYGDGSMASLIASANSLADPFFVPAGTVLTILPAS